MQLYYLKYCEYIYLKPEVTTNIIDNEKEYNQYLK